MADWNDHVAQAMQDPRLKSVIGVIEANSFEYMTLWEMYASEALSFGIGTRARCDWREDLSGLFFIIGHLAERPVTIQLRFAELNGHRVIFFNSPSVVVDHDMVRSWIDTHVRTPDGKASPVVDSNNAFEIFRKCTISKDEPGLAA